MLDPSDRVRAHTTSGSALTVSDVERTGRGCGVPVRRPRPRQVHVALDFDCLRLAGGGRAYRQPPARSVQPHRYPSVQPTRQARVRRCRPGRLDSTAPAVRIRLSHGPVLPATRGRAVELRPGTARTTCAYKGHATHYAATLGDRQLPNIAWSYEDPLSDASPGEGPGVRSTRSGWTCSSTTIRCRGRARRGRNRRPATA